MNFGVGLAEDGGEMLVVGLILWYVFTQAMADGDSRLSLHDLLRKTWT